MLLLYKMSEVILFSVFGLMFYLLTVGLGRVRTGSESYVVRGSPLTYRHSEFVKQFFAVLAEPISIQCTPCLRVKKCRAYTINITNVTITGLAWVQILC